MTAMFDVKSFNDILADDVCAPEDKPFVTTDLIALSYSLNPEVLNEILLESGIVNRYGGGPEFAEHVDCRLQSDRYSNGNDYDIDAFPYAKYVIAAKRVLGIARSGNNASYHPKLCLLVKENEDQDRKVQLIISSRNLTKQSMLEGALCLEGKVKNESTGNNAELVEFLKTFSAIPEDHAVLRALSGTDFSDSVRSICGGDCAEFCFTKSNTETLKDRLLQDLKGAKCATAVSPFLGTWEFLAEFVNGCGDYQIITDPGIVRASVPQGWPGIHSQLFMAPKTQQKLHAKLYAADSEEKSVLYVGSANFSENGLVRNRELLCRIESKQCRFAETLRTSFGDLAPCSVVNDTEPMELEPESLPEIELSAAEREALEAQMLESLGKAQLAEAFRLLLGSADADAPLEAAVRTLAAHECNPTELAKNLVRQNAKHYHEDVKRLLNELCGGIECAGEEQGE